MDLYEKIREHKHSRGDMLKPNSIKSYCICIKKLYGDEGYTSLNFLQETNIIMKKINELKSLTTKNNYLNAIVVSMDCCGLDNSFYRKQKEEYSKKYDEELQQNIKTPKMEKNWFSVKELKSITESLGKSVMEQGLMGRDKQLNKKQKFTLQDYLIALLYTELNDFVVRLDFAPMLVRQENEVNDEEHNYLVVVNKNVKYFILNKYKNAEYVRKGVKRGRGKVRINIPPKINNVINKLNPQEYLLMTINNKVMTENALGRAIKRIFTIGDRSATINIIRHINESENINIDRRKKEQNFAMKLLHSDNTQLNYAKY